MKVFVRNSILLITLFSLFFSCKKETAPEEPYVCYFDRKVEYNDPSFVYSGFYKFQIGNYWKYENKRYINDTLVYVDTSVSIITGIYKIDNDIWWEFNNSSRCEIKTENNNLYYPFTGSHHQTCAGTHSYLLNCTSGTISDPYYTHVATFSCSYTAVDDTIATPAGTFNGFIKRNSSLYGQKSYVYFKENVGKVYFINYCMYNDTTNYFESLLIDYYIQ